MDLLRDREQVGHESGDALRKLGNVGMTVQIAQGLPQPAPQPLHGVAENARDRFTGSSLSAIDRC